jgi:SH3 domain
MEFHSSPIVGKFKTIAHQIAITYSEKFSPAHTPKGHRESNRASSLNDSKKPSKNYIYGIQKSSKVIKPRIDASETYLKLKKTHPVRNINLNFVNETKIQEIKSLKLENEGLKQSLASANTQIITQKDLYEKKIQALEAEKNIYRNEYISLISFFFDNPELNSTLSQDLVEYLKTKHSKNDLDFSFLINKAEDASKFSNPFDLNSGRTSEKMTARFSSLNEIQMYEILDPICEAIALEDFYEQNEGFLQLKAGDRVQVIQKLNEQWWIGRINSFVGKFPVKSIIVD